MSGRVDFTTAIDAVDRDAVFAIRFEVFVDEQRVPAELEVDELDDNAEHVLMRVDGEVAGAARLVVEPPGFEELDPLLGPVAHLGRIALRAPFRGQGHGAAMVWELEDRAREQGLNVAYLDAQVVAIPFYAKLGYAPYGEVHDDAGIDHRHMSRSL